MKIISRSRKDTLRLGAIIGRHLCPGDIFCLFGQLGCGKTVLAKGIAKGLGIPHASVTSPSFVLIRQYSGARIALYHFDLYRLKDLKDILALGSEDYLDNSGALVIEWADRLKYLIPKECMKIKISVRRDMKRLFEFKACGGRYQALLRNIHEDIRH